MKCKGCGKEFDPSDSIMGDEGQCQCQDCWELECDAAWWRMVTGIPGSYEVKKARASEAMREARCRDILERNSAQIERHVARRSGHERMAWRVLRQGRRAARTWAR